MNSIIDQIKAYRDEHNCSLKEATDAIRAENEPRIGNDLIKAYVGTYEDESIKPWENAEAGYTLMGPDAAIDKWIREKIRSDSPKQRLDVYLSWNGILGYSSRIWELSQGEL